MVGTDAMMTTNIYLYKSIPFDPVKDFAPSSMRARTSSVSRFTPNFRRSSSPT